MAARHACRTLGRDGNDDASGTSLWDLIEPLAENVANLAWLPRFVPCSWQVTRCAWNVPGRLGPVVVDMLFAGGAALPC